MKKFWGAIFSLGTLLFIAGIIFYGLFGVALDSTNRLEFCVSCHSMNMKAYQEYKDTVHYKNRTGVRASCADCHVPKELTQKLWFKIMAYKDVLHEFLGTISTPEKYEAHRWEMANRVWDTMKKSDSRECRSCHKLEAMNFDSQGKMASKKHARLAEENHDKTCVDCHKGIAHTAPEEPQLPSNIK
ncbi:putative tetraheme cytochrome-c type [Gammaproteobacteria bacterium]